MVREISLTRGKIALVDDEDCERAMAHKWHVHNTKRPGLWYAATKIRVDGRPRRLYLHHLILPASAGLMSDHIDRNGLNCCRSNLRLVTHQQNNCNRKMPKHNKSGFRGVSKKHHRWCAQIGVHGKCRLIGTYDTPEEAARAYDAQARELYGEFAQPNFPDEAREAA